jgi:hypothetical protein
VKWNLEDTLTTGVIQQVLHQSGNVEMNGVTSWVAVGENSPVYLVRHHTGELVVLEHRDVMLEHTNHHT